MRVRRLRPGRLYESQFLTTNPSTHSGGTRQKRMTKSGHKGVSRIDSPQKKMHGWYVRVRLNNVTKSKFVPDRLYGGTEAALERAVEFRNEFERELGKPRTDWVVVGSNPRNAGGVAGVRRAVKN